MSTELDLKHLRKVAEAATDGPWEVYDRGIGFEVHAGEEYPLNSGQRDTFGQRDATYIVAFDPPTVLALLDRVSTAETKLSALVAVATELRDTSPAPETTGYALHLINGARAAAMDILKAVDDAS